MAITLSSLLPHSGPLTEEPVHEHRGEVAREWQKFGQHATIAEIQGVNHGQPRGRMSEIVARIAATGEQMMLADTCLQDGERWAPVDIRREGRNVAIRALAEMANYFALSAAHGIVNVTLRLLLLHDTSRAHLNHITKKANGFEPFTDLVHAWRPANDAEAEKLQAAAATLGQPVRDLVDEIANTLASEDWATLLARRSIDFHRLRPQSVAGGVSVENPWRDIGHDQYSYEVGEFSDHIPPDAHQLLVDADRAVQVLTDSAERWLELLPAALKELGVPVFVLNE